MQLLDLNGERGLGLPVSKTRTIITGFNLGGQVGSFEVDEDGLLRRTTGFAELNIVPALAGRLMELLDGADPDRFRRCASKKCQGVFYARRIDQLCCSRRCNNNRLQQKWYQQHGKSEIYVRASRRENR
jgi:hypothetical protein